MCAMPVEDLGQLRTEFCQLILKAQAALLSDFVAWLDLKVAEYKVFGHMLLTQDEIPADSSPWQASRHSLPLEYSSINSNQKCTDTIGRSTVSKLRHMPYRKQRKGHPRPLRPREVTDVILSSKEKQESGQSPDSLELETDLPIMPTESAADRLELNKTSVGIFSDDSLSKQEEQNTEGVESGCPLFDVDGEIIPSRLKEDDIGLDMDVSEVGDDERNGVKTRSHEESVWTAELVEYTNDKQSLDPAFSPENSSTPKRLSASNISPTNNESSRRSARSHLQARHSDTDGPQKQSSQSDAASCEVCGKWISKGNMSRHMRHSHLGETFDCTLCGNSFRWQTSLRRHQLKIHKLDL